MTRGVLHTSTQSDHFWLSYYRLLLLYHKKGSDASVLRQIIDVLAGLIQPHQEIDSWSVSFHQMLSDFLTDIRSMTF